MATTHTITLTADQTAWLLKKLTDDREAYERAIVECQRLGETSTLPRQLQTLDEIRTQLH